MREEFVTPLLKAVTQSLPPAVQKRYLEELKAADSFELALDKIIEFLFRRPMH